MTEIGLDHGFGRDFVAVFLVQIGVQRTTVDPDPDGNPSVFRLGGHQLDVFGLLDVPGVEPQALNAGLESGQGHLVLVVNVGDDGHRRPGNYLGQTFGGLKIVASTAHNVGAGAGQRVDLAERSLDVCGLGGGHGLDRDGGIASNSDVANHDLTGNAAFKPGCHIHATTHSRCDEARVAPLLLPRAPPLTTRCCPLTFIRHRKRPAQGPTTVAGRRRVARPGAEARAREKSGRRCQARARPNQPTAITT